MSGAKIGNGEFRNEDARRSFPSLKSVHMDEGSANCSEPNAHFIGSVEMRLTGEDGTQSLSPKALYQVLVRWVAKSSTAPFALRYSS